MNRSISSTVSVSANKLLYDKVREDQAMCDALRELMKDEIEEEKKLARTEGRAELIQSMIRNGLSLERIMDLTGVSQDEIHELVGAL